MMPFPILYFHVLLNGVNCTYWSCFRSSESSSGTETDSSSTTSTSDDRSPVAAHKTSNSTQAGKKSIQSSGMHFPCISTSYELHYIVLYLHDVLFLA